MTVMERQPTGGEPQTEGLTETSSLDSPSLEGGKAEAEAFYLKGNEYRRQGNWQEAINCYLEAIERDPDSPAVHAKQMLDDILNYYNKDMYNP